MHHTKIINFVSLISSKTAFRKVEIRSQDDKNQGYLMFPSLPFGGLCDRMYKVHHGKPLTRASRKYLGKRQRVGRGNSCH